MHTTGAAAAWLARSAEASPPSLFSGVLEEEPDVPRFLDFDLARLAMAAEINGGLMAVISEPVCHLDDKWMITVCLCVCVSVCLCVCVIQRCVCACWGVQSAEPV